VELFATCAWLAKISRWNDNKSLSDRTPPLPAALSILLDSAKQRSAATAES
jgi:hypothetical protein